MVPPVLGPRVGTYEINLEAATVISTTRTTTINYFVAIYNTITPYTSAVVPTADPTAIYSNICTNSSGSTITKHHTHLILLHQNKCLHSHDSQQYFHLHQAAGRCHMSRLQKGPHRCQYSLSFGSLTRQCHLLCILHNHQLQQFQNIHQYSPYSKKLR